MKRIVSPVAFMLGWAVGTAMRQRYPKVETRRIVVEGLDGIGYHTIDAPMMPKSVSTVEDFLRLTAGDYR